MHLVYIASPSYSGSTLLTLLLGAHPQIATVGELKASVRDDIHQYVCSCGTPIGRCVFWKQLGKALATQGVSLAERPGESPYPSTFGTHFRSLDRPLLDRVLRVRVRGPWFEALRALALRLIPDGRRRYDAIVAKNRTVIDAVSSLQHAEVFLDSSKDPVRLKYLAASQFWHVRVIHLVRDGRATAASHVRNDGITMAVAAREWRHTHEECERVRNLLPRASWCQVHYEELCRNPGETVDALCRFIGLAPGVRIDDLGAAPHHIMGNNMRLAAPLTIALNETWRTTLTAADLSTFERLAGDMNRRYGYNG